MSTACSIEVSTCSAAGATTKRLPAALWPYFFFSLNLALVVSLVCALVALFAVAPRKDALPASHSLAQGCK